MTTVQERIEQITAAAAARGFTAPLGKNASMVALPPSEPRRRTQPAPAPVTGSAAKLTKPLPCRWMDRKENASTLKEREKRQAARLVALALGNEWHCEHKPKQHHHSTRLVHASGMTLIFSTQTYPAKGRYKIGLKDCHGPGRPSSITVAGTRSPASIARDIQNRLLNHGAQAAFDRWTADRAESRREYVNQRLTALRLCRAAGTRLKRQSEQRHGHAQHQGDRIEFSTGSGTVSISYGGKIELEFYGITEDTAAAIIAAATNRKQQLELFPE